MSPTFNNDAHREGFIATCMQAVELRDLAGHPPVLVAFLLGVGVAALAGFLFRPISKRKNA